MSMRVDISELKTMRQCPRKWQLSSRNAYHLRPMVTPSHFTFGTIFHEALHQLYLGANPDKVLEWVQQQIEPGSNANEMALPSMVRGYIDSGLLAEDFERYQILEVEHHFEIPLPITYTDINLCGSIDMLVLSRPEFEPDGEPRLYGFEHKICKNFRTGAYLALDDQLRVYNWVLFHVAESMPARPKVGGLILNETRKLLRQFDNKRQIHSEARESLERYIKSLMPIALDAFIDSTQSQQMRSLQLQSLQPQPCADFMHCQMCEFSTICETYGVQELPSVEEITKEFDQEFIVRECDHLDEKVEREVMK